MNQKVEARQLSSAAEAAARGLALPVSIAVVDATTYLQAMVRMDGAPLMSAQGASTSRAVPLKAGTRRLFLKSRLTRGVSPCCVCRTRRSKAGCPYSSTASVSARSASRARHRTLTQIAETAIASFLENLES